MVMFNVGQYGVNMGLLWFIWLYELMNGYNMGLYGYNIEYYRYGFIMIYIWANIAFVWL